MWEVASELDSTDVERVHHHRKFCWAVLVKSSAVTLTLHFNRVSLAARKEWTQGPCRDRTPEGGDCDGSGRSG